MLNQIISMFTIIFFSSTSAFVSRLHVRTSILERIPLTIAQIFFFL